MSGTVKRGRTSDCDCSRPRSDGSRRLTRLERLPRWTRRIGQDARLYAIQPGKGEPKLLTEFRTGAITGCRFTPDSKGVVFVYGTSSKDVVLISDFQ